MDYEDETRLIILVIPTNSALTTIKIIVEILDENDNSPQFPVDQIKVNFNKVKLKNY